MPSKADMEAGGNLARVLDSYDSGEPADELSDELRFARSLKSTGSELTPTAKWRGTSCAGADHTFVMQRWTQWLILPRELCSKGFSPSSRIALKPASWRVSS